MKVLLQNAFEAWRNAIYYHEKMEQGFLTLQYQKGFVSALHNAVELFLKQMMLDQNEYGVMQVRNLDQSGKHKQKRIELMRRYLNAPDLNTFFTDLKNNSPESIKFFYSIEFSALIQHADDLIGQQAKAMQQALKLLKDLRNNETHFYIDADFLTESDFCLLHNFMADFYEVLLNQNLIPNAMLYASETPDGAQKLITWVSSGYKHLEFTTQKWQQFSYRDAVTQNPLSKEIADKMREVVLISEQKYSADEPFPALWITEHIWESMHGKMEYDLIMAMAVTMEQQHRFRICQDGETDGLYQYRIAVDLK